MEYIRNLFTALLQQDTELAFCRSVGKHLANVYLYDRHGISALHPILQDKAVRLVAEMKKHARPIVVVSTVRTAAIQQGYWQRGRGPNGEIIDPLLVITDAQGLQSYHNYGLAFDVAFDGITPTDDDWQNLGYIGEQLGLEWGGRWENTSMGTKGDRPHFQWTDNGRITWKQLEGYFKSNRV